MMKFLKEFIQARLETKIFLIVSIGLGLMIATLSFYPYVWFVKNRITPREITENPQTKVRQK